MTDEDTPRSSRTVTNKALYTYLESLVTDPEHASLDAAVFAPDELPLARQALELGEFITDERHQAEELAEGIFETNSGIHAKDNPLTESFEGIRTNLAVPTAIADAIKSNDYSLEFDADNEYLAQLKHSVEELRKRHKELERNAYTDFLTGVGNSAALNRDTSAAWDSETAYTLAFVDIDGLKYCNDHYGHAEGNHYICEVAEHLKRIRRPSERIYRIGGDEFVMLSPCSSEAEMNKRLESCRKALIGAHAIDDSFSYSFSYGCSHATPAEGDTHAKLVNEADKRMYDYKLLHSANSTANETKAIDLEDPLGIQERVFQAMSFQSEGRYLFVCNMDTDQSHWSRNAVRDFGLPGEVVYQMDKVWASHIHPDDLDAWKKDIGQVFSGEKHHHALSYRAKDASGRYVMVNCSGVRLDGKDKEPTLFVGTIVNRNTADGTDPATGLEDARSLIAEIDRRKQRSVPTAFIAYKIGGVAEVNSTYGYEAGNDALSQMADRLISKIAGRATLYRSYGLQFVLVFDGVEGLDLTRHAEGVRAILEQPVHVHGVNVLLPVVTTAVNLELIAAQPLSVLSDLNRRLDAATRSAVDAGAFGGTLKFSCKNASGSASVDGLTGLMHSSEFLSRATEYSRMHLDEQCCIIALDLGHMRIYNEWYGRQKGDSLLAEIGAELSALESMGAGLAGHWGQDDFSIHMRLDIQAINVLYNRIRNVVASHDDSIGFMPAFGVYPLQPGSDVGISDYDKAKFALEDTRDNFKKRIAFFNADRYRRREEEHLLLSEFQRALATNRVNFFLQPQYNIITHKVVGAEALARWQRVDGSFVSPGVFVPLLERNGFIVALDRHIWKQVFKWIRKCHDRQLTPPPISINVSRIDIDSIDVAECLSNLAKSYRVSPRYVKVEITESMYTENRVAIEKLNEQLKELGFSVYMDDFGSGQSSLSMLRDINIDAIKLDGGFFSGKQAETARSTDIVTSVVKMTKSLGLPLVVEGVETEEQSQFLRGLGVRYVQGFLYYRPMPALEFESVLKEEGLVDCTGIVPPDAEAKAK